LLAGMHRKFVQRHSPAWSDRVQIHAVTLRQQIALSLRFIRADASGALKALGRGIALSPSTALPALFSAAGQLIAYRRKMRKLDRIVLDHQPAR